VNQYLTGGFTCRAIFTGRLNTEALCRRLLDTM